MGKAFYQDRAFVRALFEEASDIVHLDLATLCFQGPAETLVRTDRVQPAITTVNLACHQVLCHEGITPSAAAGHSLGEYSALCAAGALEFADCIRLVHLRGKAMQEAAQRNPGGMVAVFGLGAETLSEVCADASEAGSVEIANDNSPLQLVLTGDAPGLRRAVELAKQRGAKLTVPLKVSGPWHSRFMAEARDQLRNALQACPVSQPSLPVVANVTGEPHSNDPDRIREALLDQLVRPVRWTQSVRWLALEGHQTFVEAGPGKVLGGLVRSIDRSRRIVNVQDTDSLAKLLAA